jgi:hypothetical protein
MGELLDRYTERRPLLLVTEDLHWSDRATIQLINRVETTCSVRSALGMVDAAGAPLPREPQTALRFVFQTDEGAARLRHYAFFDEATMDYRRVRSVCSV